MTHRNARKNAQATQAAPAPGAGHVRAGNALVLAMGILMLVVSMVVVSSTGMVAALQSNQSQNYNQDALNAVQASLSRHTETVALLANQGDPAAFSTYTNPPPSGTPQMNYGQEYFGSCKVRWKIEPAVTAPTDTNGNYVPFIANPAPDPSWTPPNTPLDTASSLPAWQTNDLVYLYMISADAVNVDSRGQIVAHAQGATFSAMNKTPLFRYVIFYVQSGPKGDLEFTHGPAVNIVGNVHSNGAIYFGSGSNPNDWTSLKPSNSATTIGSSGAPVRVEGVGGIFCLSKPVMYAALNYSALGLTVGNLITGTNPNGSFLGVGSAYSLTASPYPGDPTSGLNLSTFLTATSNGTVINPYRVTDASNMWTVGNATLPAIPTNPRTVNGNPVIGGIYPTAGWQPNDSRDFARPSNVQFDTAALGSALGTVASPTPSWNGGLRSGLNGAHVIPLTKNMKGRPFEVQALQYNLAGNDPSNDDHNNAEPLFYQAGTVQSITPYTGIPATNPVVEVPAAYPGFAIGSGNAFVRRTPFTGWDIKTTTNGNPTFPGSGGVGLTIRERMEPAIISVPTVNSNELLAYNPALTMANWPDVPVSSTDFLPYAYGKQKQPAVWPFTSMYISSAGTSYTQLSSVTNPGGGANAAGMAVIEDGRVVDIVMTAPGAGYTINARPVVSGAFLTVATFNPPTLNASGGIVDFTVANGGTGYGTLNVAAGAVLNGWGNAVVTLPNNSPIANGTPVAGNPSTYWCTYRIGGTVLAKVTNYNGDSTTGPSGTNSFNDGWGFYRDNWRFINLRSNAANLTTPVQTADLGADTGTPTSIMFDKRLFQSLQARVTLINGGNVSTLPSNSATGNNGGRKIGLMIRPFVRDAAIPAGTQRPLDNTSNGAVTAMALNGRQPYVAMLYSPERGFFTQQRWATSEPVAVPLYFTGTGLSGTDLPGTAPIQQQGTAVWSGTPPAISQNNLNGPTVTSAISTTNINTGEGSLTFSTGGSYSAYRYSYMPGWKRTMTQTFKITSYTGSGFIKLPITDVGRQITINSSPVLTGAIATVTNPGVPAGYDTITVNTSSTVASAAGPNNPATTPSAPAYVTVSCASNQIWWNTGNWSNVKSIYASHGKSEAQLITELNNLGWIVIAQPGAGGVPAGVVQTTVPASPSTATAAGVPADPILSAPWTTPNYTATGYSVPRSSTVDINSWTSGWPSLQYRNAGTPTLYTIAGITSRDNWFFPSTPLNFADQVSGNTFPGGAPIPSTHSFSPDMWTAFNPPNPPTDTIANGAPNYGQVIDPTGPANTRWKDDLPVGWVNTVPSPTMNIWLRLKVDQANTVWAGYYYGPLNPPTGLVESDAWMNTSINTANPNGWVMSPLCPLAQLYLHCTPSAANSNNLLVGLAMSSGTINLNAPMTCGFDNITIWNGNANNNTAWVNANSTITNANVWEGGVSSPNLYTRYLASQYQVFFGPAEITEDFFKYNEDNYDNRAAVEQWFYNPREFWSQSRWFNDNDQDPSTGTLFPHASWIEKETGLAAVNAANLTTIKQRNYWAKTTVLNLNMAQVNNYLLNRSVTQATMRWDNVTPTFVGTTPSGTLASNFNGLFYVARTNRYPVNPQKTWNLPNPFNPLLPNSGTGGLAANNMSNLGTLSDTVVLNPYAAVVPLAPAIKPQDFVHGVMISNAKDWNWGYPGDGTFGVSKSSFVTPNQLYVLGDLNTTQHSVNYNGTPTMKTTPVSIMGDSITMLSNAWNLFSFQAEGITVNSANVTGGAGVYAGGNWNYGPKNGVASPNGSTTTYNAAICTNNQPTTFPSVIEGQSAAFLQTMNFIEDWASGGATCNYTGSLVVMDSRRYANSYLLDSYKVNGSSPFGMMGQNSQINALGAYGTTDFAISSGVMQTSLAGCPPVYGAPNRTFTFQLDLLTQPGTPPFTPIGVTASGLAGWDRIVGQQ